MALTITALPSHLAPTPYDNYVRLADAFLHGHIWVEWPGERIDAVLWNGQRYVVNDPVPALLLLPLVAWQGIASNQTLLSVILAGIAGAAAWRIGENLDVPLGRTMWLAAFIFAGTDLWWGSVFGDVWFLAQTAAVAAWPAMTSASGKLPKRVSASHQAIRLPGAPTEVGPSALRRPSVSMVPGGAFGSGV